MKIVITKLTLTGIHGHMAKTKKQIAEDLKLIDIIIEILDARIPRSSQNPDIKELIENKNRLIVLNKSDLACEKESQKWIKYFESKNLEAVLVDSVSGKGIQEAIKKVEKIYDSTKYEDKGRVGKAIRIMILGIPNVGKSSFINRIAKKNTAGVGNKPGFTKQKQWIKVANKIELLDTPGVLWPKLNNQKVALNLAYTKTIKEEILETTEIGYELLKLLIKNYSTNLIQRYEIEEFEQVIQNKNLEENEKVVEIMNLIGKKRGAIISGGEISLERVSAIVLEDFRSGKLGKITLEKVED